MRIFLRDLYRKFAWRLRSYLGVPCASAGEIKFRINRLPAVTPPGAVFNFPWAAITYVSASDLRGQFAEIYDLRHYAFRTSAPAPVIIDAGGNIGMSAIWFKREYPQAKVTVYEADADLAALLAKNLAAAKVTGVDVQNAAVWIEDGTVSFDNRGQDKGMVSTGGGTKVRSVDLALHLPERVDLLKLDIEGAEYALIDRLCSTGNIARVQNLVAEFHVNHSDLDAWIKSLRQLREAGMQVTLSAEIGPWLGAADAASAFEIVGKNQVLAEVYAWR
jgi:FkbM family methyltransferase